MNYLIGISGRKHHGKDSVADGITSLATGYALPAGISIERHAFAEELKETCKFLWKLTEEQVNGDLKEVIDPRYGITPREIMQRLGSFVRSIDPETWVRIVTRKIEAGRKWHDLMTGADSAIDHGPQPHHLDVITDCRHPNEAVAVRALGGVIWKVVRPEASSNDLSAHESETEIDRIEPDVLIRNDGSLDDLRHAVHGHLEALLAR